MYIDGNIPYPAKSTPFCTFIPILVIDFGSYVILVLGFGFLKGRGLGGLPFSALSAGMLGSIMGLRADISSPLLHIGHVRYS